MTSLSIPSIWIYLGTTSCLLEPGALLNFAKTTKLSAVTLNAFVLVWRFVLKTLRQLFYTVFKRSAPNHTYATNFLIHYNFWEAPQRWGCLTLIYHRSLTKPQRTYEIGTFTWALIRCFVFTNHSAHLRALTSNCISPSPKYCIRGGIILEHWGNISSRRY